MKKIILFLAISLTFLLLFGCGKSSSSNASSKKLDCIYSVEYFDGYRFKPDKTVIYYQSHWTKAPNEPLACKPTYKYGTYNYDGSSLTVKFSGGDKEITGVFTDDGKVVIDGKDCEKVTKPYYDGSNDDSWKELDKTIGLDKS